MLNSIIKFFKSNSKNKKVKVKVKKDILILDQAVDATFENEVKEINKQKETKDTKSTLTFGV
tara:strand:- start:641 stop:826 length:186 start_codon:yes stop_codon:yes gene_type:complete